MSARPVKARAEDARDSAGFAERANSLHERSLVCTVCGVPVRVCGYVQDLDASTFVGRCCGCVKEKAGQ